MRVILRLLLPAVAAAAALLLPGCAARKAKPSPDVVLVTIDRLRWEELAPWGGAVEAPALAELNAGSARFVRAVTPAPGGAPAALSVLTGLLPKDHGVRVRDDGRLSPAAQSLADRLGARGWATGAFLQDDQVTLFMQADRGFDAWDAPAPGFPTGHPGASLSRGAEETVAAGIQWLRKLPDERAGLLWIELSEPAPPEIQGPDRATRLGELDRLAGALLRAARARGESRGVAPIVIACNLSSHGPDPSRAAAEAFVLAEPALRVRVLASAPGLPKGDVAGLAGLDEVAPLAEALATGGSSRLLDLARGRGDEREHVIASTLVPHESMGVEPLKVAVRAQGEPAGRSDAAVAESLASDTQWPGGHGDPSAASALEAYLALDAAWTALRQGRRDDALAAFEAAAPAGAPAPPDARAGLGLALVMASRPKDALAPFAALAAQGAPGSLAWTQGRLGTALAAGAMGDAPAAQAALGDILARTPGDLRALTWQAQTSERSGDRAGAVRFVLAIVEQDPDNPIALAMLGRLYMASGKPREAADAFDAALQRQPTHPGLLLQAADALSSARDWWSAMDRINERVRLYGPSPETDLATARCWRETGRWEATEAALARYVAAMPQDPRGRVGLGEAQLYLGKEKEAAGRAELRRARELAPGDPSACETLKSWARATGRDTAAEASAEGCP